VHEGLGVLPIARLGPLVFPWSSSCWSEIVDSLSLFHIELTVQGDLIELWGEENVRFELCVVMLQARLDC